MVRADAPWRARYENERDELIARRIGWCGTASLAGGVATVIAALGLREPAILSFGLCLVAISLPVGVTARTARGASIAGAAYVTAGSALLATLAAHEPGVVPLTPALLLGVMLGSTLLLPWGALRQGMIVGGTLAAFALVANVGTMHPVLATTYLVVSAGLASVVGAHLVANYRASEFERRWVQEELVVCARALARHVDTDDVARTLVGHAERLVPARTVVLALRDAKRGTIRVVADTTASDALRAFEVDETLAFVQAMLASSIVVLPDDDPSTPLAPVFAQHGVARVLYATLRHAGEAIGILSFVRHHAAPFSDAERLIVHGLAEQAALALATARLVADLRAADRLKTEFVSTMSHELRTPLNVILGFAEMLADGAVDEASRTRAVARIELAGRDLLELIENTLAIGRLEAGRDEVLLSTVSIATLWQDLGERCARMPRRPEVVLAWSTAPPIEVRTDPHKLQVVVANLVSNALKFTERGHVEATLALDGGALVVRVADTGIGIRREDQAHVFDMFRRVDSSDARRYGGTGLGLYIVRRFVEQLGGTVALESAPETGSVFTVRLAPALPATTGTRAAQPMSASRNAA
jgi:signal transduction histidine kinase